MAELKMGAVQTQFAELIWQHEPIASGELVKLCQEKWGWKKPTIYTVLRKLCERGIFRNENHVVTSRLSKAEYNALRSEKFVDETFDGSLPAFIAAFTARKPLSETELEEIRRMIDGAGRER